MKKNLLIILAASLVFVFSSCNDLKKMMENADDINYSVNPQILEVHGGEVAVNITGSFPEKYFRKKVEATLTPVLVYEGGETALTPVYLQGEKIQGNAKVIDYKPGGNFTYNDKFEYNDAMRISTLELRITAVKGSKQTEFAPEEIAKGVLATPTLVINTGKVAQVSDKFVKDIPTSHEAVINFDKNLWNIKANETKSEDIESLNEFVKEAAEDERKEMLSFNIRAYASPEGEYDFNEKVSGGRKGAAETFVKKEYKNIEEFKAEDFLKTDVTVEDWEGFKKAVAESNLADKDMILRVVQMQSDPVEREAEIRNMTATFEELENLIHPRLRRSELQLNIMLIGNTDEEINQLFDNDSEELTVEEFLYLGKISDDLDRKLAVYTKTTQRFPNEWRGFNNLGFTQYKLENYDAAKIAFDKAKSLESNATVFNNLGVMALIDGDLETAKTNFTSATGVPEASHGQGIIEIKKGNYSTAVDYFGDDCSFNAGLAKLLAGNTDDAIKAAECGEDKDNALNYYLKAVAGARKGDTDLLFNNLRTAVTKDDSLKELAKTDMEFHKYFDNNTFQTIVE
jgi:tetratricopeptide (TPR) repeat protein